MINRTFLLVIPYIDDGGVEKVVANMANFIRSDKEYSASSVYIFAIRKGNGLGKMFFNEPEAVFINFRSLLRICFSQRRNIILFSALTPANILGCILSFFFRLRFFPSHNCVVYKQNPLKWFLLKIIYKVIYLQSVAFIATSEGIKDNLENILKRNKKVLKLYNPVIVNFKKPFVHTSINPQLNVVRFCALGRLAKQKGFDIAIKAFSEVKKQGFTNFEFHIAGNGEELASLEKLVQEHGLEEQVFFKGFVTDHEAFYSGKDYYLFPSRYEGLGLALIEAMNYGLPVISSDCEYGPSEILLDGSLGTLIREFENVTLWKNVLIDILKKEDIDIDIDYRPGLSRFLVSDYIANLVNV